MCGSSAAESGAQASEASFSQLLQQQAEANFGAQSQVLQNINQILTPIAEAGPSQTGFSPQELAALNTQAIDTTAAGAAAAQEKLNTQEAGRGGDTANPASGTAQALSAQLASGAENQLSQEELGITQANYAQGNKNFQQALTGLGGEAEELAPSSVANVANTGNQAAFGEASQINQQNNQVVSDLGGLIPGALSALGGGITGVQNSPAGASQPLAFLAGL